MRTTILGLVLLVASAAFLAARTPKEFIYTDGTIRLMEQSSEPETTFTTCSDPSKCTSKTYPAHGHERFVFIDKGGVRGINVEPDHDYEFCQAGRDGMHLNCQPIVESWNVGWEDPWYHWKDGDSIHYRIEQFSYGRNTITTYKACVMTGMIVTPRWPFKKLGPLFIDVCYTAFIH